MPGIDDSGMAMNASSSSSLKEMLAMKSWNVRECSSSSSFRHSTDSILIGPGRGACTFRSRFMGTLQIKDAYRGREDAPAAVDVLSDESDLVVGA